MFGNRRHARNLNPVDLNAHKNPTGFSLRLVRYALSNDNALRKKAITPVQCTTTGNADSARRASAGYVLAWDVLLAVVLLSALLVALPTSFQLNETTVNSYNSSRLTQDIVQQLIDFNQLNDFNSVEIQADLNNWLEPQWKYWIVLQKFQSDGGVFELNDALTFGQTIDSIKAVSRGKNYFVDFNSTNDVSNFNSITYWVWVD